MACRNGPESLWRTTNYGKRAREIVVYQTMTYAAVIVLRIPNIHKFGQETALIIKRVCGPNVAVANTLDYPAAQERSRVRPHEASLL